MIYFYFQSPFFSNFTLSPSHHIISNIITPSHCIISNIIALSPPIITLFYPNPPYQNYTHHSQYKMYTNNFIPHTQSNCIFCNYFSFFLFSVINLCCSDSLALKASVSSFIAQCFISSYL